MMQANQEIRQRIKASGIRQWRVSDVYGIHEQNFSRMLRRELAPGTRERILIIIDQLVREDSESR
jgi:predicted XRE-type DNA-binding protein